MDYNAKAKRILRNLA